MSTVLGLDLSLRRTGLALWCDGDMSTDHVGHDSIDTKSYTERIRRVTAQAREIQRRIEPLRGRVHLVAIELPLTVIRGTASDVDVLQLHGFVLDAIVAWRMPFAYVHNQWLKAFATGKAKADKDAMVTAARACGWPAVNHDEADAAHLASLGAMHLGDEMPFAATAWRDANLEKVAWPEMAVTR